MIILGLILLVIGLITGFTALFWIGVVLAILGAVLMFTGGIGGRRLY